MRSSASTSLVLAALALAACARRSRPTESAPAPAAMSAADHAAHHPPPAAPADSAFAALQRRGASAMGVDQYTSAHQFESLADGGRIELQRMVDDPAGVAAIRAHLRDIAAAFAGGDFSIPGFVHLQTVPGTGVMRAKRAAIAYAVHELPRGGEVRITTRDPDALAAVHEFLAFQRSDHRVGEKKTP